MKGGNNVIEDVKQFLHDHQLPIEWLAIQSGLSKRTVLDLFAGKRRITEKEQHRLQQAIARKND